MKTEAPHLVSLPVRLSPRGDYLKDADNQTLADLRYHTAHTEAKELLVRAVNCHAELLDALKAIYECGSIKEAERIAIEAYAKATGRVP